MKITNAKHKNTKKNTRKLNIFKEQIHTNNIAFWFVQLCDPMAYSKIRPDSLLQQCSKLCTMSQIAVFANWILLGDQF